MLPARSSSTAGAGRADWVDCHRKTYSVITHPERFAPLHTVAEALIDYLTVRFEASSSENPAFAADLMHSRNDVLRAVRITPASTDASPLTFVFTTDPGVLIHAGLLHDFPFPDCGCDACDETAEAAAEGLGEIAMAVAQGRYQETYDAGVERPRPPGRWVPWPASPRMALPGPLPGLLPAGYRIVAPDGSSRARGEASLGSYPADRLATAKARLERLDDGWQPWPFRQV